jgi:hypothetical protein
MVISDTVVPEFLNEEIRNADGVLLKALGVTCTDPALTTAADPLVCRRTEDLGGTL